MSFSPFRYARWVSVLVCLVAMAMVVSGGQAGKQESKAKKKETKATGKKLGGDDSPITVTGGSLSLESRAFRNATTLDKVVVASCPDNPTHRVPSVVFNNMAGGTMSKPIGAADTWSIMITSPKVFILPSTGQGPVTFEDLDPNSTTGFQASGRRRDYTPSSTAFTGLVFVLNDAITETPCDTSSKCQIRINYHSGNAGCRP